MKMRTLVGICLIVGSLPLWGGGAFIISQAIDEQNRQEVQRRVTETQCLRHLEGIPTAQVQNSGKLTVTVSPVAVPMDALATVSTAIMQCPTRDLVEMCLGDECDPTRKGVVSLVMKFDPTRGG